MNAIQVLGAGATLAGLISVVLTLIANYRGDKATLHRIMRRQARQQRKTR